MTVLLSQFAGAGQQVFTSAGVPLAGGLIYSYGAGGSTPLATYTTSAGNIAHSNPIQLDAAGRVPGGGEIWLTSNLAYKFLIKDSGGSTIQTLDNVGGGVDGATLASSSGSSLVGFIQAGSGAVLRTAQNKMRESVSVLDFGADPTGANDSTAAFVSALATQKRVFVPKGQYLANINTSSVQWFDVYGEGMNASILQPFNSSLPAFMNMSDPGSSNFWRRSKISDLSIRQTGQVGNGFTFGNPSLFTSNDERIGRVDFINVEIQGFDKGIFKTCGNIANSFTNCRIQNNNYNYYAQSSDYANPAAPTMHAGADNFYSGSFGYAIKASIFIRDRVLGHGGWTFSGVDIEGSSGYAVVALASNIFGQIPDITFDACWFEANATGGSITIDGLTGTITGLPRDIYVLGNHHIVARSIYLGKITLLGGANMIAEKCGTDTVTAGVYDLSYDNDSTFIMDGWAGLTGNKSTLTLAPYASKSDLSGLEYTPQFNAVPSPVSSVVKDYVVRVGRSGTSSYNGSFGIEQDGMTFNLSNVYVITASTTVIPSFTTVANKYYAISIQIRLASGAPGTFAFDNLMNAYTVDHAEWRQYNIVKKATTTSSALTLFSASSSTFRIGSVQVIEFDTSNAAYEYLYKGRAATNSDPRGFGSYPGVYQATGTVPGNAITFNSATIAANVTTSAYQKLLEASFVGGLTNLSIDFLIAHQDSVTGTTQAQTAGFNTVAFSSISATPTLVLGAATLTFRWVLISGTVYQLEAQSAGANVAISGLAFIKGK